MSQASSSFLILNTNQRMHPLSLDSVPSGFVYSVIVNKESGYLLVSVARGKTATNKKNCLANYNTYVVNSHKIILICAVLVPKYYDSEQLKGPIDDDAREDN